MHLIFRRDKDSVETKTVKPGRRRLLFSDDDYDFVSFDYRYNSLCMTALGVSFVEACLENDNSALSPLRGGA